MWFTDLNFEPPTKKHNHEVAGIYLGFLRRCKFFVASKQLDFCSCCQLGKRYEC